MGAADVVPGVSGGTIAFVTGIYERLLGSINRVVPEFLDFCKHRNLRRFLLEIDAAFLLVLLVGILTSVFLFSTLILHAISASPIQVWSFFSGLIVASVFVVGRDVLHWRFSGVLSLCLGVGLALLLTSSGVASLNHDLAGAFLSGMIAICAMILPGISGSLILLLLGTYSFVLGAVKSFDIVVLIVFAAGCGAGLLAVSRVITWMLAKYRDAAICFLIGLMLGSLQKIWPWKQTISMRTNSRGEEVPYEQVNLLPSEFTSITGISAELVSALVWCCVGIIVIFLTTCVLKSERRT